MSLNMIIGLGNTGSNIVKLASSSMKLENIIMYAIDSVASSYDHSLNKINVIPIISDDKSGSGRNRERGKAMYEFHESQGAFDEMYKAAEDAKTPVLVITSAAGGTGSGATVPVCKALIERGIHVIPIIVCPNKEDPAAFHLNTNDLLMELGDIGVETYSMFENRRGDADYTPINTEVVELIELNFGKHYDKTDLDSIDDSDLDVTLSLPGRIMGLRAEADSVMNLKKELTRKAFVGFQPAWDVNALSEGTIITAFALKSLYSDTEFKEVFSDINARIPSGSSYDEYRHIVKDSNNGKMQASMIISGLPRPGVKEIANSYKQTDSLGTGIQKSIRPSFAKRKSASIVGGNDGDPLKKFKWSAK